ncbi:hypothetical protein L249_2656 [Ophiocordyceps polyrhachis-furcata BCC 54312]|uniref:OPT family small oligopeptide transporter n=1 Tax=Ophiocordyceps polyrhachis-furcata BCC 54312 TaxID=1330021 RepID=A0A367LSN2_9HYPO|nr:hypothetical protein L249_2656 [Ophiocordyceps polyrhachis-furcata BCC 54312]
MKQVLAEHENDPNFHHTTIQNIKAFLANEDMMRNPDRYEQAVDRIKLEAALITTNSPYAEVRANVDNHDDPSVPVSTIRAWTLGCLFSVLLSFVNQLFSIRQPYIRFDTNIAQLLSYPLGKCWERWLPSYEMTIPFTKGAKVNLNPGPFNKKEHMLIAIMANTSKSLPYTNFMIWTQVLPQYFNQQYARSTGYIFLNAFATNFIGYGLAGIMRNVLVRPSYCIWPTVFSTIALNAALHPSSESERCVRGPMGTTWSMSRYRFFLYTFSAMFVYFWFPNYLFQALSYFSWMTWIAPDNLKLNILTGMQNGLGLFNPLPTFDWNVITYVIDPLFQMMPSFTTFNAVAGMFLTGLIVPFVWFTNTWNTGFLPIISNHVHDHFGKIYNVSNTLDSRGMFDRDKYAQYSRPYLSATRALSYGWNFAIYTAIMTRVVLYHRPQMVMGFRSFFKNLRFRRKTTTDHEAKEEQYSDVHSRLMSMYSESESRLHLVHPKPSLTDRVVPEWWFFIILAISVVMGILGIVLWPTYTSPAVVLYGILLCLIFIVPIGVTASMTGLEITLNVLAEFIGGVIVEGNALAMNFFKSYGHVTTKAPCPELEADHHRQLPPRVTFMGQMLATLISTIVCTGVFKFQIDIKDVCTPKASMRFFCPGPNTFMTASVLWGTIGPVKVFGKDGYYKWLLMGFPIGCILVTLVWMLQRRWPDSRMLRQVNVVVAIAGSLSWAPYSFSYAWPAVPFAWFSWIYVRGRHLDFWSKYNYVLSASLSAGVAISAIVMLFTVQWAGIAVNWWGNTQPYKGCEGSPCLLYYLAEGEHF